MRNKQKAAAVATMVRLRLTRETFVRGPDPLEVDGLAAFRRSIGLDSD